MCTSVALIGKKTFFGRNMDIDYNFGECAVNTPRGFPLIFKKTEALSRHFAFLGTAAVADNYPLYAEAMNENGLYIAALKFTGNAYYSENESSGKINLAPYEIIPFVLSKCRNLAEAKSLLSETEIIALPFSENLPLSPLHWHIADRSGSLTLEKTTDGMRIYENPANTLTNNPPFPFHLQNRVHYRNLSAENPGKTESGTLGLGSVGLPGDFTSASRFIRADFLLRNTPEGYNESHLFHILQSVAIPKGAVKTAEGRYHYTSYCCCFDADRLSFSYRTYENTEIRNIILETDGDSLTVTEMN